VSKPPNERNNTVITVPLTAESLYFSKKGIEKKIRKMITETPSKDQRIKEAICKCHCKIMPAINGVNNRIKGAFFQM